MRLAAFVGGGESRGLKMRSDDSGTHQAGLTGQPDTHDSVPRLAVGAGTAKSCWHDCGAHHQVSVLSCLLASTLLMPSWLLGPPTECRQTSSAALGLAAGAVHSNNRRLSLSVAGALSAGRGREWT